MYDSFFKVAFPHFLAHAPEWWPNLKVSVVQHSLQFLFVLQQIILSWSTGDHDSIWHFSGSFCPWYCVKCHRMHFAMWFWASNRLEVKNWISLCLDKTFRVLQPPVQLQHKHYEHIFFYLHLYLLSDFLQKSYFCEIFQHLSFLFSRSIPSESKSPTPGTWGAQGGPLLFLPDEVLPSHINLLVSF